MNKKPNCITHLVERRFGIFQDRDTEAFGEPAADRREQITGFRALALIAPEALAVRNFESFALCRTATMSA